MKKNIILTLVIIATLMGNALRVSAQESNEKETLPLHVEASLMISTPHKDVMPFGPVLDINYSIRRFSIHALFSGEYFLPKEGMTKKYNKTLNLGGGVGFELFPRDENNRNVFEVRASVAAGLGSDDFKNTSYRLGLEWHSRPKRRCLVPTVGVGYNVKDFSKSGVPTYHGMYLSLGLRF